MNRRSAGHAERFGQLLDEHAQVLDLLDSTSALRGLAQLIRERCGAHIGLAGPAESERLIVLRQWAGTETNSLHDLHVPLGLGLGGRVFAELKPVWVNDYCASEMITHDFDRPISADRIRTMLAVPMVRGGQVYGVLYAAKRDVKDFSDRQLEAAMNIASSGALALQTASAAQRQRESAAAAERRRIASDLHDSVGARLFRIGAELRHLRSDAEGLGEGADLVGRLAWLEDQLGQTASAFRESVHALDHDEPNGWLGTLLAGDCVEFQRRTGITAQAVEVGEVPECDQHRTRIVVAAAREAMLNVEKHADARSLLASLIAWDGGIVVSVADDGHGWAEPRGEGVDGIGLSSTTARLEALGGTLSVVGNEDGGLTVRIWVPLP